MEVQGMVEIFSTSVEKYSVRYKYYIGDGDAKTFPAISAKNVYGDNFQVEKRECCGHTAKRFGKKARDLKTKMSGQKLPDGKGLSGQGRLTGKWLDKLQQFNGNAIRENCNSVQDMRNAIWATYFHYISTDKSPQHSLCPVDPNSWCKWQRAKNEGSGVQLSRTCAAGCAAHRTPSPAVRARCDSRERGQQLAAVPSRTRIMIL